MIEGVDERLADLAGRRGLDLIDVEEDDEDPRTPVLKLLARFGQRGRLSRVGLRSAAANGDVLERVDLLRSVVLENLEIVRRQIGDRTAV